MNDLISRSELISKFSKWLDELKADENKGYASELYETRGSIEAIESAIAEIESMPSTGGWISCAERMPEDGINVLICSNRGTIHKAAYDSDMGYFLIDDSDLHYNELDITYWQPLPEPPEV